MSKRLELQNRFRELLGSSNVYYQPPESIRMQYPCIVYEKEDVFNRHADDYNYLLTDRYTVTYISKDPDNTMDRTLLHAFQMCSFDRRFTSDNLYHDVFTLYY